MMIVFWILGWVMWNGIAFFILRWLDKKFDENCSLNSLNGSMAVASVCLVAYHIVGFTAVLAAISLLWKDE